MEPLDFRKRSELLVVGKDRSVWVFEKVFSLAGVFSRSRNKVALEVSGIGSVRAGDGRRRSTASSLLKRY